MSSTRMFSSFLYLCFVCALLSSCDSSNVPDGKLRLYVVGDGVPPTVRSAQRNFPLNRAQGKAMWDGASLAFESSSAGKSLQDIIEIIGRDDIGSEDEARRIAQEISEDPLAIGVIGHATSGTTISALRYYRRVGIPLLMPIATSDAVRSEMGGIGGAPIAFRLPPSDGLGQAPAIEAIRSELDLNRILLVSDASKGAQIYSKPLTQSTIGYVSPFVMGAPTVDKGNLVTMNDAAQSAIANRVDGIIFIGYGSTAQEFFEELRDQYVDEELANRPVVVLTDGCRIPDLNVDGFRAFMTFPNLSISSDAEVEEASELYRQAFLQPGRSISYEAFGFDSVLVLAEAIVGCKQNSELSRSCVRKRLAEDTFIGISGAIEFEDGENRFASYDVFEVFSDESGVRLELIKNVSYDRLAAIRKGSSQ